MCMCSADPDINDIFSVGILIALSLFRANLSDSYFTNRQDRYVFLQDSPEIADFFTELVDAVGDVSLQLQPDDTVKVMEGMVHPYQGRRAISHCILIDMI